MIASIMMFSSVMSVIAKERQEVDVYYETKDPSIQSLNLRSSNIGNNSWASLDLSDSRLSANFKICFNNYIYETVLKGNAEKIIDGYVGIYQGYIKPAEDDEILNNLLQNKEDEVLVTVNVTMCDENKFFTVVIGAFSDEITPIAKAYGEYTNEINKIIKASLEQSKTILEEEKNDDSNDIMLTAIDATTRYKASANFLKDSKLVGQVSLFHANELRNQNSMSVYAKVNSNRTNANNYAREFFGLNSTKISTTMPGKVNIKIESNDALLHVDGTNYNPKTGTTKLTVPIPYYVNGSYNTVALNMTINSVTASTSGSSPHYNQKINWSVSKTGGMLGIDGTYSTNTGLPTFASYKYEGSITSDKTAKLTATASIVYNVYVEDSIYGTITTYSFTTGDKSCTSTVKILAD